MRAIAIEEFGGTDKLTRTDLPRPRPAKGEVLVRIVSAGVNPVDCLIRSGQLKDLFPHAFPLIPGWDVAGVVEELAEGVSRFRKGDRVWAYARKPVVQWGCYAEYVSLPENILALMPTKLLFEEAAGVPLAALTAFQCLVHAAPISGSTVLIQAGAGGVGHFAVQLAHNLGARIFATVGTRNQEFVLSLGAEKVIDYTKEDFVQVIGSECPDGVDLVLDSLGGEELARSLSVVKPGGRVVSIVEEPSPPEEQDVWTRMLMVEPDALQLAELARLVDQKKLAPHVQKIYPLAEAADAQQEVEAGHVRGKLVLNL